MGSTYHRYQSERKRESIFGYQTRRRVTSGCQSSSPGSSENEHGEEDDDVDGDNDYDDDDDEGDEDDDARKPGLERWLSVGNSGEVHATRNDLPREGNKTTLACAMLDDPEFSSPHNHTPLAAMQPLTSQQRPVPPTVRDVLPQPGQDHQHLGRLPCPQQDPANLRRRRRRR